MGGCRQFCTIGTIGTFIAGVRKCSGSMVPWSSTSSSEKAGSIPASIGNATRENINYAFKLLPRGSSFDVDARLCDAIADSVYTVWRAQRRQDQLSMANEALEQERKKHEWNAQLAGQDKKIDEKSTSSTKSGNTTTNREVRPRRRS